MTAPFLNAAIEQKRLAFLNFSLRILIFYVYFHISLTFSLYNTERFCNYYMEVSEYMEKTCSKLILSLFLAVFMLHIVSMPAADQKASQVYAASTSLTGKVSSSFLNIHTAKSTSSKNLKKLKRGAKVKVISSGSKWVTVSINGKIGYAQGKYIKTSYGTASNPYSDSIKGTVTKKALVIRSAKSGYSKVLKKLTKGTKVKVLTTNTKWVKVKYGKYIGYVIGKYVKTENGTASDNSSDGEDLVAYAKHFLGNPYVYGGSSLTNGTDCSGFVMALYKHWGYSLPHSSSALRHVGHSVSSLSKAEPGDIICYSGHVAIYMGNNRVIHASNPSDGIKITNNARYRNIVAIRRIF